MGEPPRLPAPLTMLPSQCLVVSPQAAYQLGRALAELERIVARSNGGGSLPAELRVWREQLSALGAQWVRGHELLEAASTDVDVSASVRREAVRAPWSRDLIDASQAAALLGCTAANVRDLGRRGRLTVHKRGRGSWFDPAEVAEWRDERAAG